MTTSASPTAATATIEARTATCEMLSMVRNWGAANETRAPRTTMIATRLSSRCRAIAPNHAPRSRGATRAAVSAMDPFRRIGGQVVAGMAGRREHHGLLGGPVMRDLGGDPTL